MTEKLRQLLQGYTALVQIPVAWGEMDALGHVNNIVYLRYFETTRIRLCEQIDFGVPNVANLGSTGANADATGPILGGIACKYKLPVTYPDVLWAGSRVQAAGIHEFGFDVQHIVVSTRHERTAAEGTAAIVCYDYALQKKARLKESLKNVLLSL
jgi:acyl-CoA thioester hydrolase